MNTIFFILPLVSAINSLPSRFHDVDLKPCDGWTKFLFGNSGDFSYDRFHIQNIKPLALRLTDAFCAGDEFAVYDWGRKIGTVRRSYDAEYEETPCRLCKRPVEDPEKAWDLDRFASRQFILHPGRHRITVKSITSPIGAGYAFIKLMDLPSCSHHGHRSTSSSCPLEGQCSRCDDDYKHPDSPHCEGKFTLFTCKSVHSAAADICKQKGLTLAAITKDTFDEAAQLIFTEGGAGSKAWIGSYNGDSYGDNCLAFTVGQSLPSGNINLAQCSETISVLCQRS